jgi:glycerol kinase
MGAAFLAGIEVGLWSQKEIVKNREINRVFTPEMEEDDRKRLYNGWKSAVKRSMGWLKDVE